MAGRSDGTARGFAAHLRQPDHWTFLLALGLVSTNVALGSRRVSAAAAALLVIALVYDAYEFYIASS